MRTSILLLATASALSGCVAPMLMQHPVRITSEPPGAVVTFDGKTIGTTPLVFDVRDEFGFFSTYEFVAHLPNRADATASFKETTVLDAQGVVPETVNIRFGEPPRSKP
jgi:hypothetical protein